MPQTCSVMSCMRHPEERRRSPLDWVARARARVAAACVLGLRGVACHKRVVCVTRLDPRACVIQRRR